MSPRVPTDGEILNLIRDAVRDVVGDADEPSRRATLDALTLDMDIDDIGLDSVMSMEVVGYIEEQLDREFPDDRLARIKTLGDLAALIREG